MLGIGVVGYGIGAALFGVLALVLLTGPRHRLRKRLLFMASVASALWLGTAAWQLYHEQPLLLTYALELLRDLAWIALLARVLTAAYADREQALKRYRSLLLLAGSFVILLITLLVYRFTSGEALIVPGGVDGLLGGYLVIAITGLALVEQLYRNTRPESRRAIKYLCLGMGGLFAYDFYLYSDALLFQRINAPLWEARGYINALVVPVIGIAVARDPDASMDIFVSRRIVFHTASLLGAGAYLLAMGAGGYYVRFYGGDWGAVAQVIFLFGAVLVLVILLLSRPVRARLRVFINKHFFHYKYDYRDEWLRLIGTLSSGQPDEHLRERAVRALCEMMESRGGLLWLHRDSGRYEPVAAWHLDIPAATEREDSALVAFLARTEWVINLDEYEREPGMYAGLTLPAWLDEIPDAWLITPLFWHDRLIGFIVLAGAPAGAECNWEDFDLLKTAGRQIASHLAQLDASRALAEARQFEMCNRLSTYVLHDLKNLVSQLSLVVTNAARHKHNPQFMEDAIRTVEHSVEKMNALMTHLRTGGASGAETQSVDLCELLREVADTMSAGRPVPSVDCQVTGIHVRANRDRFGAVIGHLVRNAQDATPDDGRIIMRLFERDGTAVIEVQDTGCGMDETFIRERLFQPFESTKGSAGMGIGVYETRELVRGMGGDVEVISRVGEGTTFRLRVPISAARPDGVKLEVVGRDRGSDVGSFKEIAGR